MVAKLFKVASLELWIAVNSYYSKQWGRQAREKSMPIRRHGTCLHGPRDIRICKLLTRQRAKDTYSKHQTLFLSGQVGISRGSARSLAYWDCGFETRRGYEYPSLVSVVCCQVEVSVLGWSLVQRSPAECGASECDREAPIMKRPCPTRSCRTKQRGVGVGGDF